MKSDEYHCPLCESGFLRAIPPRELPAHFVCRSCREKFRAEYQPDMECEDRILIYGIRHNPEIERRMAEVGDGQEFVASAQARVAKLNALKCEGVPMELDTVFIAYLELEVEERG